MTRKIATFLLIATVAFAAEAKTERTSYDTATVSESHDFEALRKGKKKKNGRYKKRKRLFRKKKGCDCPKH